MRAESYVNESLWSYYIFNIKSTVWDLQITIYTKMHLTWSYQQAGHTPHHNSSLTGAKWRYEQHGADLMAAETARDKDAAQAQEHHGQLLSNGRRQLRYVCIPESKLEI